MTCLESLMPTAETDLCYVPVPRRVCEIPGCGTVLSRYNRTSRCCVHRAALKLKSSEFCSCGKLHPIGSKLCAECKKEKREKA